MKEAQVTPTLHLHLFGEFQIALDDTPVTTIDLPRLQSLLTYLVLHRHTPQARTHLAFLLWPDSTDSQAHTNLRTLIHRLRHALPASERYLRIERQTLQWLPRWPWTLDVAQFEQALSQAKQAEKSHDDKNMKDALQQAAELYQGNLLPGCYDEWILPERDRLQQLFLNALEQLSALQEQERDYQAAIMTAQRLLRHDPLHEATYRHLMRLHAGNGDRVSALRTYHTCATVLERELGAELGRTTRAAYERLVQLPDKTPTAPLAAISPPQRGTEAPLVGRKQEWARLQDIWRKTLTGHAQIVLLVGEAGIGKTRLAEELQAWIGRQGIDTASASCYAAEGPLAYAPVATWLRTPTIRAQLPALAEFWRTEVARLVPELLIEVPNTLLPNSLQEGWQRQRLFEALAHAILRNCQPLLLLLDDIQWCDQETLEWLHYLLRFNVKAPLLLVATMRPEEVPEDSPLAALRVSLQKERQVSELTLNPLDSTETSSLAAHLTGRELDPLITQHLYRETEGNPLFVVEMTRTGILKVDAHDTRNAPLQAGKSACQSLPPTVKAVIEARLAQLSPLAREVGSLAAVIGRAFTFTMLAQTSDKDEDALVQGLDELWQKRIIREQSSGDTDAYDFSHDKLREGAYATLSPARRRQIHRRVAESLETSYAETLLRGQITIDTVSGQIAAHYERAALPRQAILAYQRAGEAARQIYANTEALHFFQRALYILTTATPTTLTEEWRQSISLYLLEEVGDILCQMGQCEEARATYQQALVLVPATNQLQQARLHRRCTTTLELQRRYEEARSRYDIAEQVLGDVPLPPIEAWWFEWIQIRLDRLWLHHIQANIAEMSKLVDHIRPFVEQHGVPEQQALFLTYLVLTRLRQNHYVITEDILEAARTAVSLSHTSTNPRIIASALLLLGICHTWLSDFESAEEQLQAALAISKRIGDVSRQARCLSYLTLMHRKRGQTEQVYDYGTRALAIATQWQIGEDIYTAQANLAWVALRKGNVSEAQALAQEALTIWRQIPYIYPFCWTMLWPLISIALIHHQLPEAIEYTRTLLFPYQERLPTPLREPVEAALKAWDAQLYDKSELHLQEAVVLAREIGYL